MDTAIKTGQTQAQDSDLDFNLLIEEMRNNLLFIPQKHISDWSHQKTVDYYFALRAEVHRWDNEPWSITYTPRIADLECTITFSNSAKVVVNKSAIHMCQVAKLIETYVYALYSELGVMQHFLPELRFNLMPSRDKCFKDYTISELANGLGCTVKVYSEDVATISVRPAE